MKKVLPLMMIGILVISGLGAVAIPENTKSDVNFEKSTEMIVFSQPTIEEFNNEYLQLCLGNEALYLMHPGKPMMPRVARYVELPFGARNVMVEATPQNVQEYEISKEILPAPVPVPLSPMADPILTPNKRNDEVYSSDELFPLDWCSYTIGCGLNSEMERVTHLAIDMFPVRYAPAMGKLYEAQSVKITITYEAPKTDPFTENSEYDMVIIAPSEFSSDLQRLVDHKNNFGVDTTLKTTEGIYDEYSGADKPEQIKYFIKDAIESWNVKYVLLVGGLNSLIYARPRDDCNQGSKDWHVPVRYSNMPSSVVGDPGYLCDLYYADIYKEEGVFDDWDSNGNGIFAEWGFTGDKLDMYPDVALGRLACRNTDEVNSVVDKIINYEKSPCDPSWFNKIIGVTGDGFLDQEDLNIEWDTNAFPDGDYTIYAQSTNDENESGPVDEINIELDKSTETSLSFNHDDHLNPALQNGYPAPPIAEIVSVSNGDILGNTDYTYNPTEGEAYCNRFTGWAKVEYKNKVIHIRGKSYDPKLYGNITDIHVWIKNGNGETVFNAWRNDTKMFSEGDWTVGEKLLHGRAGAFYYMPNNFEKIFLSSANGQWTGMSDVIDEVSKGAGFLFFSGHGSPNVWMNQYPGIPGNRQNADVEGLKVINVKAWAPFVDFPILPMDKLANNGKSPIAVVGGCHNSMFNVSMIPAFLNMFIANGMWTYGTPVPETFSWYLVKLPETGAIASMGNTGLGYGVLGEWCTSGGVDNWITTEFFKQYGTEGHDILGVAYSQTLSSYFNTFGKSDAGDVKTVQQWVLLGDPSLKIGGYS